MNACQSVASLRISSEARFLSNGARDAGWIQNINGKEVNLLDEVKPYISTTKGRKNLDVKSMPPEMLTRLQDGVMLLMSRDIQRMHVGELPLSMHKWLGSFLTQFKSFPYAALSKQLVHDVRGGDKLQSAGVLVLSAGLAYAMTGVKSALNYYGDEDIRRKQSLDRYMSARMDGVGGFYNVLMATGQLSGLSLGFDAMASLNLLPEDIMASADNGWAGARGSFMPPSIGVIENFGKNFSQATQGDLKALESSIPFAKSIGINQVISHL